MSYTQFIQVKQKNTFHRNTDSAIFAHCQAEGLGPVLPQQVSIGNKPGRVLLSFLAALTMVLASWLPASAGASEQLFLENCAVCHQADGRGLANVYPALATSEVVRGSAVDVALVLIIGRGEMPSFKGALSSADMASIINYIRNAWGNSGEEISAERIASLR